MKKILIISLVVICIFSMFVRREVLIIDTNSQAGVPYASVILPHSQLFSDSSGSVSFVSSIFQRSVKVQRIGYIEREVTLPFHLFYSKSKIFVNEADYSVIEKQLKDFMKGIHSYAYSYDLSVKKDNKVQSQHIEAMLNGNDFLFDNKSDFTGANYKILYKGSNLYLLKDGNYELLKDEEKEKFTSQNILFISAPEIVSSLLLTDKPEKVLVHKTVIDISWDTASGQTTFTVLLNKNGFPYSFEFTSDSDNVLYQVKFELRNINGRINIAK